MRLLILLLIFISIPFSSVNSQRVYSVSGGEMIFQSSLIEQAHDNINTNVRFTLFFHLGEFIHADMGNNIGLFSGIGLRNIGFITDEHDVRIKYRSYNLGVPLAIKIGSFRKNFYFFGGAEYEWMFQFKQKTFVEGDKSKYTSWFSNRTPKFIPSVIAGVQFPDGIQLKMRYYLDNFLNQKYNGGEAYNNYTLFNKTQIWYISISYMIRNNKKNKEEPAPGEIAIL